MTPYLVANFLVGSCGSTVQAPESGGTVSRKYAKFLITSKSLNFAFAEIFEGSLENPGKGLQGQEKRSRARLGNFSGIPRDGSDHGRLIS